jgi:hypothetical protein
MHAVSSETAKRCMSSDMSGSLSDKADGTTPHAQITNTCSPTGQSQIKRSIFITDVSDDQAFPVSLRGSCPGGLTTQLNGKSNGRPINRRRVQKGGQRTVVP